MQRVKLTKDAKAAFMLLDKGVYQCPKEMPFQHFNNGMLELRRHDFAVCHQEENGNVEAAQLTEKGKLYLSLNPSLHNPIDWKWLITTIIACIAAISALIALLIACSLTVAL